MLVPNFLYFTETMDISGTKNSILCNDLLFSIRASNIFDDVLITDPFTDSENLREEHEADKELLLNLTKKVFPMTVDFEYEIKNVAPYQIAIGCNCTIEQMNWLMQNILTPSYPTAEYALGQVSLSNLSDNHDLFILFESANLSDPAIISNITEMLEKGKGFVLIRDITEYEDDFTKELFEMETIVAAGHPNKKLEFNNLSKPETAAIAKRFVNNLIRIDTPYVNFNEGTLNLKNKTYFVKQNSTENCTYIQNCSDCLSEGKSCVISGVANITLYQIDPLISGGTIIDEWLDIKISGISNKRDYRFMDKVPNTVKKSNHTILMGKNSNPVAATARIADEYSTDYFNRPRVFWIYDYNKEKTDLNLFLKTGIIWASGEHYSIHGSNTLKTVASCTHFYTGLRGNNIPFTVKLYYGGY